MSFRHSLKTRITLGTLALFLVSFLTMMLWASHILRRDMQRMLSESQFSTASILASDINTELSDRFQALQQVAAEITPALLADPAALQAFLNKKIVLQDLFNAGAFATGPDGITRGGSLSSRIHPGVDFSDRDYVINALQGRQTVGKPLIGRIIKSPLFTLSTPIRGPGGQVIGVLGGGVNLGLPNFLDKISQHVYGQTGGYLLVDPKDRLIVAASDKRRIMESLPSREQNTSIDHFVGGGEGSHVFVNPMGVEVLASHKDIPAAGWYLAVSLPTAEAFAPIGDIQRRLWQAAALLTLAVGALKWWYLKRQLSPMLSTMRTLAALPDSQGCQPHTLPLAGPDEIGQLIGSFNRLLERIGRRERALSASEARFRKAVEEAPFPVLMHTRDGTVLVVNRAWTTLSGYRHEDIPSIAQWTAQAYGERMDEVRPLIASIFELKHRKDMGDFEIRCKDGSTRIWQFSAMSLGTLPDGREAAMSMAADVTERKQMEEEVRRLAFYDALTELPNRRLFIDRLKQALTANRRSAHHGAVMFVDLDEFKQLNDTHGHAAGDQLLAEAARRMRQAVRGVDTVARLGGDEFVLMISELGTDTLQAEAQARGVADKIGAALGQPYDLSLQQDGQMQAIRYRCSASIGLALFGPAEADHEAVLKRADAVMYQAKQAGGGRIRIAPITDTTPGSAPCPP